jgi:hypothetical protein
MYAQDQDPLGPIGASAQDAAVELSTKMAEGYIKLALLIKEKYDQSERAQKKMEDSKLDEALKEGGFARTNENREKVKAWSDAYEANGEAQKQVAKDLGEVDKQISRLETIGKMSPDEQERRGFGVGEGLTDPSKEMDNLLGKKLELGDKLEGLTEEAQMLEQGKGLEGLEVSQSIQKRLDQSEAIDEKLDLLANKKEQLQDPSVMQEMGLDKEGVDKATQKIDKEIEGLSKNKEELKGGKEVRPGSVFDSLVKSGYMEKGGLSFMNDNALGVGQEQAKHKVAPKQGLR